MNDVTTTVEDQIKDKLIAIFKPWCEDYCDGKTPCTPRYCQLDLDRFNTTWGSKLYSTVHGYDIHFSNDQFTPEEMDWFRKKFKFNVEEDICYEPTYIWDWWKSIRREVLLDMFGTTNPLTV